MNFRKYGEKPLTFYSGNVTFKYSYFNQEILNPNWKLMSYKVLLTYSKGFPGGLVVKDPLVNAGDTGSIPGLERFPWGGDGYPLQYSCWEIPRTEKPDGLQSMGLQRVGHNLVTKQIAYSMSQPFLSVRFRLCPGSLFAPHSVFSL